jgi:cell division septation protein DedD
MAATTERPRTACPRCGVPAEADQLLCLECGGRIGLGYRRPPTWRLPAAIVAGVVLLAGAAVAFALIQISDDAERVASAPAPTEKLTTTGGQPAGAGTTETAPAPARRPATGEIRKWPADTSAYTVILLSTSTRTGAETVARQAAQAGIPAGVLRSDDYSSLNPGYWVVFAGEYDSQQEAQQEAVRYAGLGFSGGYARFVNGHR